jgi:hypothetical protein
MGVAISEPCCRVKVGLKFQNRGMPLPSLVREGWDMPNIGALLERMLDKIDKPGAARGRLKAALVHPSIWRGLGAGDGTQPTCRPCNQPGLYRF